MPMENTLANPRIRNTWVRDPDVPCAALAPIERPSSSNDIAAARNAPTDRLRRGARGVLFSVDTVRPRQNAQQPVAGDDNRRGCAGLVHGGNSRFESAPP